MSTDESWKFNPPAGWFTLGTHIDSETTLEFWGMEDGLPIWERPARGSEYGIEKDIADAVEDYRKVFPLPRGLAPNLTLAVRALEELREAWRQIDAENTHKPESPECAVCAHMENVDLEKVYDQNERLIEKATELIAANQVVHKTYPNTTACWGGIGGQAITPHCAHVCDNPVHDKDVVRYNTAQMALIEEIKK